MTTNWGQVSLWADENTLKLDGGYFVQCCEYTHILSCVYISYIFNILKGECCGILICSLRSQERKEEEKENREDLKKKKKNHWRRQGLLLYGKKSTRESADSKVDSFHGKCDNVKRK